MLCMCLTVKDKCVLSRGASLLLKVINGFSRGQGKYTKQSNRVKRAVIGCL
jgi:hypothetical protein